LTALTFNGVSVLAQNASTEKAANKAYAGTLSEAPSGGTLALFVGDTKIGNITETPFSLNYAAEIAGQITLRYNNSVIQTCGSITDDEVIPGGG